MLMHLKSHSLHIFTSRRLDDFLYVSLVFCLFNVMVVLFNKINAKNGNFILENIKLPNSFLNFNSIFMSNVPYWHAKYNFPIG